MTDTVQATTGRPERYNPRDIEKKWQDRWAETGIYEVDLSADKPKYYFLTMYPYPSGNLHVGHWYAETPPDAAARYRRMQGHNVLFPLGFDAFGLPAENAAVNAARAGQNVHPATLTYSQIAHMTEQYKQMGTMTDWSKTLNTCDPEYYRWNQWCFIKMFEKGLAYRSESFVNWDPVDQTVLANEQVIDGRGDRSGALVERRLMPQWDLKITDYADELLDFSGLDWPERVKLMQTNWIGRSEGAEVTFKSEQGDDLTVFTTRPDTLWGATFVVLAPEHPLVAKLTTDGQREAVEAYVHEASHKSEIDRQMEGQEKTGVFTGAYAINPVNGERVPVWIADYVLLGYGTGVIMAVPAHDERDLEFARKFNLEVRVVIQPEGAAPVAASELSEAFTGEGVMVNSGEFDGTRAGRTGDADGISRVIDWLEQRGVGQRKVTYRLRDWLISRQRYWGTPIPMIYCDSCGLVPEKLENLPVRLPEDVEFMPTGESPLKHHEAFLNTTCPTCGEAARRETDTMDTFMDSSWYWFRYLSPHNSEAAIDSELAAQWTPVDMYTGGVEHAILHLLYSRFFTKVLRDLGIVNSDEPFLRLRNQGMILGGNNEKMSKSRGNVADPDDLVAAYGADTVRAYLMFLGPWDQGAPWSSQGIEGVSRFLNRVWNTVMNEAAPGAPAAADGAARELRRAVHHAIREVTEDLEEFSFNTALAELMTLQGALNRAKDAGLMGSAGWDEAVETLLLLLAPIAPHITEELWHLTGHTESIHLQSWPVHDESALTLQTVKMAVQVSGRVRGQIEVAADADQAAILAAARAEPNVARYLTDASVVREIVVPGRLVNFVVRPA
jgi:leucyl-tRNA synthetase